MENFAKNFKQTQTPPNGLKLVPVAGEPIPVIGQDIAPIHVGDLLVLLSFIP